jgi:thiol-disulfide isomerase/thioredoxin
VKQFVSLLCFAAILAFPACKRNKVPGIDPLSVADLAEPPEGTMKYSRGSVAGIDKTSGFASLVGKPFNLKVTGIDGGEIDAAKLRGKVVMVDFWATWCSPCVREVPEIVALYRKYHDQGLEIIGISCDSDVENLKKFIKINEMPWAECLYKEGVVPSFTPPGIPTAFLVNRKGDVAVKCSMSAYRESETHAERKAKREADIVKLLAE